MIGVLEGTFSKPMPIGGGKTIAPTGKPFKLTMATIGHWTKAGVMDEEYLFWDNADFMKQMVEAYNEVGGNLISVLEVPHEAVSSYGVIAPGAQVSDSLTESYNFV